MLTCELFSVDADTTGAVALGEVTTLEHELVDDAVEFAALVTTDCVADRELTEVARGFGDYIVVEVEDDAGLGPTADSDVKLRGGVSFIFILSSLSASILEKKGGWGSGILKKRELTNTSAIVRMWIRFPRRSVLIDKPQSEMIVGSRIRLSVFAPSMTMTCCSLCQMWHRSCRIVMYAMSLLLPPSHLS